MAIAILVKRELTRSEVFSFFCIALGLYVYPLIDANYLYIDDIWRTQLAEGGGWAGEGRVLIQLMYNVVGFNASTPNVFPLPLMVSVVVMACALNRLVHAYFKEPTLSACLVVLPVWYNPFFLQNLSYQYDGAAMALSLAVMIYAITCRFDELWKKLLYSASMIACGLAFYQPSINFFIVLCCAEVVKNVSAKRTFVWIFKIMGQRLLALCVAALLYYLCVALFLEDRRAALLEFDVDMILHVSNRLVDSLVGFNDYFPQGIKWLALVLIGIAFAEYIRLGKAIFESGEGCAWKTSLFVVYLLTVPVSVFFILGPVLFFKEFTMGFRVMLGLPGVVVLVFFLSHKMLVGIRWWAGFLQVLPLMYSLSVSYAYGRVLTYQKELEISVLTQLAYDIEHSELRGLKRLNVISAAHSALPPAAEGLYRSMPIIRDLFEGSTLLSEMLLVVGVDNAFTNGDVMTELLVKEGRFTPFVETTFYNLYKIDGVGYVLFNDVSRLPLDNRVRCLRSWFAPPC